MPNQDNMRLYDTQFFESIRAGSVTSARELVPLVLGMFPTSSVLDVGCGEGAWLSVFKEHGVTDIVGVDGPYVNLDRLSIPKQSFISMDLASPFGLGRAFDMVVSLEVGEHLPASSADGFVESLTAHSQCILFSAAPPGQGGDHHVNEQPYSYWKEKFERRGFVAVDAVRDGLRGKDSVKTWYKNNTFLYVSQAVAASLPGALADKVVPPGTDLVDISSRLYRFRKRVLALLPIWVLTQLARTKGRMVKGAGSGT